MANCVCEVALVRGKIAVERAPAIAGAGAVVDFCGNVRPAEGGQPISGIEYEAHSPMAEYQMRTIAEEAANRFRLVAVTLYHSFGFIGTAETSLFLRVAATHRGEAFTACQWIVDQLKKRVPIWKTAIYEKPANNPKMASI